MKKILFIISFLFLFSNITFAQLNTYPNQTTVSKNSEMLWWDNATVNQTFDNVQNQITDSTLALVANSYLNMIRTISATNSSINITTSNLAYIDTISTNTTYTLSNPQKGVLLLFVYSTSTYTIDFSFSGNLYAPYEQDSFTTDDSASYTIIQIITIDTNNVIVMWQPLLNKIN